MSKQLKTSATAEQKTARQKRFLEGILYAFHLCGEKEHPVHETAPVLIKWATRILYVLKDQDMIHQFNSKMEFLEMQIFENSYFEEKNACLNRIKEIKDCFDQREERFVRRVA